MALREILRDRAAHRGGTAQVDCGELGYLTVEALSPSDCAALSDSRALLYAACRELQTVGEELRSEGKLFRPDEIMAYVTDDEADAAARIVLELSGLFEETTLITYNHSGMMNDHSGIMNGLSEIRHQSVQGPEAVFSEIRHQSVQASRALSAGDGGLWAGEEEIRRESVQVPDGTLTEDGQVSHEFFAAERNFAGESDGDAKSQILGDLSVRTAQILASNGGEGAQAEFQRARAKTDLHEIKSENSGAGRSILHETESELRRQGRVSLHETESEFGRKSGFALHETTSDSGGRRGILLHESESEYAWVLHEVKSELQKALHEIKSEVAKTLHETKSELAEEAAQRLVEGLMRAGQVR